MNVLQHGKSSGLCGISCRNTENDLPVFLNLVSIALQIVGLKAVNVAASSGANAGPLASLNSVRLAQ